MENMRKLPDAEFDIMKVVWANEPPITTSIIMQQHGHKEGWKLQTAISLLLRLVERGFLRTEKNGKVRTFFPLVNKEDYLRFETEKFIEKFHDNSVVKFISTMYNGTALNDDDIDELHKWVKKLCNCTLVYVGYVGYVTLYFVRGWSLWLVFLFLFTRI